jgi:hypothetical protein
MKDKRLIDELVDKGEQARQKVIKHFTGITAEQLNWKMDPVSWSIGQCLDHLIVSDCAYFPALKKITAGNSTMSLWQKYSPLSGMFGKVLVSQVTEIPKKNMNAPKVFNPSASAIDMGVFDRFYKHLDTLIEYISLSSNIDLDKIKITSPVSQVITYSLRNAYLILMQHEHRHINQAIRVKSKL